MARKPAKTTPTAEKQAAPAPAEVPAEATPDRTDPTPLENYTLAGVAAGKPTPESRS